MKKGRESIDYLRDIRDVIDKAQRFVEGMDYAAFAADEKTVYAVVRAIEIVGEATKSVPTVLQRRHPELPWRDMAGMRDRLIHGYFKVRLDVVWEAAHRELPALIPAMEALIREVELQAGE